MLTVPPDSDLVRYAEVAGQILAGATPYAQVDLEYPPGALVPMLLARALTSDLPSFARLFAAQMVLLDLVTLLGVARLAGRLGGATRARLAAAAYVLCTTLLGGVLVHRMDLAASAPLVWAVATVVGPREGRFTAAPLLALAAFTKLFALALLPLLLLEGWRREGGRLAARDLLLFCLALLALGLPAAWLSSGELFSFLSFHAGRGVQLESAWGSLLLLASPLLGGELLVEEHHHASHLSHPAARAVVVAAGLAMAASVGLVTALAARAARSSPAAAGRAFARGAAAVITALVVTSPILSPQYLLWLLPLAAALFAAADDDDGLLLLVAIAALTRVVFPGHYEELRRLEALPALALLARNALLVWLLARLAGARAPRLPLAAALERGLFFAAGLTFFYWAAGYQLTREGDADLFLHLKVGATVLDGGSVPRVDEWSATAAGRPFVAHEWLAGASLEALRRGLGEGALTLLRALAGLVIALAAFVTLGRARRHLWCWPLLTGALVLVFSRLTVRPHLYSLVFAALLVLALEAFRNKRSPWVLVPFVPLQVLWANLHGGHVIAPVLLVAAAAAAFLESRREAPRFEARDAAVLAGVAAACLLAGLINPYGAGLYLFALELFFQGDVVREHINEWMPSLSFVHRRGLWYWLHLAWLASLVVGLAFRPGRRDLWDLGLAAVVVYLSLGAARFLPYLALVGLPLQARSLEALLGDSQRWRRRALPELLALVTLLALTMRYGPFHGHQRAPLGFGIERPPYAALVDDLKASGARGPLFSEYDVGAWLLWRGGPELRPVIDARIDVYGDALAREYFAAREDPSRIVPYLDRHGVDLVLLRNPGPSSKEIGEALLAGGRFVLVESREGWVLFGRAPAAP